MESENISLQLNKYLAKLNDESKAEKYLNKISQMKVSMKILYESDADLRIKKFASHPTLGSLAQQISDKWEQVHLMDSPSSVSSGNSSHTTGSVNSASSRTRYIIMDNSAITKFKVDTDYEDTDDEEGRKYDEEIDELIKKNLEELENSKVAGSTIRPSAIPLGKKIPLTASSTTLRKLEPSGKEKKKGKIMAKAGPLMKKIRMMTGRK